MEKPIEYYLAMDLPKASKSIITAGARRKELEIFLDAINSIYFQANNRHVSEFELHSLLGTPDFITEMQDGNAVHTYEWTQHAHGNKIESKTSFLIKSGLVSGLAKNS